MAARHDFDGRPLMKLIIKRIIFEKFRHATDMSRKILCDDSARPQRYLFLLVEAAFEGSRRVMTECHERDDGIWSAGFLLAVMRNYHGLRS